MTRLYCIHPQVFLLSQGPNQPVLDVGTLASTDKKRVYVFSLLRGSQSDLLQHAMAEAKLVY